MEISGFQFLCVDDDKVLLKETYRLRYKVYCHEAEFLDDSLYPEEIESDVYDDHSIHFAALDQEKNIVGTLRLILHSNLGFPLEVHCPNYDKSQVAVLPSQLGEISRLAVSKDWRRRKNDGIYGMTSYHSSPENPIPENLTRQRKRPIIVFGLYKLLYLESKRRGITHWYAAMEQKLNTTLKKFSFEFKQIGPVHDYYGPVMPFLGIISEFEKRIYQEKNEVFHLMLYGLERHLMPKFGLALPLRNYLIVKIAKLQGKI
jgi:N-acyl amino acid synthase of PEP-CTERM/exosortase system